MPARAGPAVSVVKGAMDFLRALVVVAPDGFGVMQNGIYFISGLPRSGSTSLAALRRQNPRFRPG
ncbi:MAG TPA: hypothetical protein VGF34_02605 [Stellaceae bacterium]|jgi:hypothetical protein